MRYGIISDIHSNLPALEVVITYLKNEVDAFLCLGDIVGYGAQPNECCDIIRELRPICVAGNHDWGAVE
ncbi:MAG: metallophosphoesterase family protein, partial [bacterium]